MIPPRAPYITIKRNDVSDNAKAKSFDTPILVKKYIVVASLKPRPPIDIGSSVMAPIIGTKIKK